MFAKEIFSTTAIKIDKQHCHVCNGSILSTKNQYKKIKIFGA